MCSSDLSELPKPETKGNTKRENVVLELQDVTIASKGARNLLSDISFKLHAGEVIGIAGVEGNGQSELTEAILGLLDYEGCINFDGECIDEKSVADRRDNGIGFIPEDRHRQALMLGSPLWENRILGYQRKKPIFNGFILDKKATIEDTKVIMQEFDVRAPGPKIGRAHV